MKFVRSALLLALIGSSTVSAKLNSPNADRGLQISGIFGGDNETSSFLDGVANTASSALDSLVNKTTEAIGGLVENVTMPDFVADVVNGTSMPDLNGTLDGFMPEGGLGPVISGGNETGTPEVSPETLPAEIGSTVAPETLPVETGSTVAADEDTDEEEQEETDADALEGGGNAANGQLLSAVASIVAVGLVLTGV